MTISHKTKNKGLEILNCAQGISAYSVHMCICVHSFYHFCY